MQPKSQGIDWNAACYSESLGGRGNEEVPVRFASIVTACLLLCGVPATASAKGDWSDEDFEKLLGHNSFLRLRTKELRYEADNWRARIARDGSVKLERVVRFRILGISGSITLEGGGKHDYKAQKDFLERTRT